ncbi:MAG: Gfo/Idh/MocA family oxidoreductase [Bacteroidia bacterium]|nr:Gfo/Idh/MocA family oxidoreductase [Bacteroidia bacterium]
MKVLIVGLGSIAKKHIQALRIINDNIQVYALRSSVSNEEDDVINLYQTNDLDKYKFNFIIISTPTHLHEKNLLDLAYLNIPFFIEKPLSNNLEVISVFENLKNIKTYVACNLRFLDCLNYVKDNLDFSKERVNEVNVYSGSYLPEWRPNTDYKKNYSVLPEKGGGVHIDLIHEIDYVYWIFGQPLNKSSYFKSKSTLDIKSIDYANYILEYNNFSASIILNYYRRDSKRTLEIVTDNCTYFINLFSNEVYQNNKLIFKSEQKIVDTYENQLRYFIDSIEKKEPYFNTAHDGFEVLKICIG